MATILKNIVQFTGLAVGVPMSAPHALNVNGTPVTPQLGGADASGFDVTADTINVTVTRTSGATSGDVNVYVEHWHTIESVTPPNKLIGLTPFFFAGGGGGSGGFALPVTPLLEGTVDLTANMTNLWSATRQAFTGTLPLAASVPNGTLLALRNAEQDGNGIVNAASVNPQGGDQLDLNGNINLRNLGGGISFVFVSDGSSNWWVIAYFISPFG